MAVKEDLGVVLVQGTLVVSNSGHILDDHTMVRVLTVLVQDVVRSDHVVDDVGLGNLLGAELLLGAKIHAVIVAQVIVRGNGGELDTSADHEVNQSRLHLGLARLEIVAPNEGIVLLSKLNSTRHERVLRGAVDEWNALKNRGNGKDSGRRDLFVTRLNSLHQIVRRVVNALNDVGVALSVSSPLYNNLVEIVGSLEVT